MRKVVWSTVLSMKVSSPFWLDSVSPGSRTSTSIGPAARACSISARSVSLGLKVLTYSDLPFTHPGYQLSLAQQVAKEALARTATVSSLDAVLGGGQKLF